MNRGYSRCSTNESKQDIGRQVRELKEAGAEVVYMEYEHGDAKIKNQQQAMFAEAEPGDSIIVLPPCQKHTAALRNHRNHQAEAFAAGDCGVNYP